MKTTNTKNSRQALETRYNNSRANLLWVCGFTVINIILLVTKSDSYFLFSAYIPYILVTVGMLLCGMYPKEYIDFVEIEVFDSSVFTIFLVVALIFVALYFISWFFSKNNRVGWLIFSLVFFAVDTLGMFAIEGFAIESIIDIAFHVWVLISLSLGISACHKLKKCRLMK